MLVRVARIGCDGSFDEPYELVGNLPSFIPHEVKGGHDQFLTNGFRVYVGGSNQSSNPTNLEQATPECITPRELARYMRASEILLRKTVEGYATTRSIGGYDVTVRVQKRVVDSQGSRKGCHDNFALPKDSNFVRTDLPGPLREYLATRFFMVGAGYVPGNGALSFSQKVGGLTSVQKYGFVGSMGRIVQEGDSKRLEVRCSDINISDWAACMRVGGVALLLALGHTPLVQQLAKFGGQTTEDKILDRTKNLNAMHFNPDGSLMSTVRQRRAVAYQQWVADLALNRLSLYADVPSCYLQIAEAAYNYCDDFRKVVSGEATLDLLASRADWAAKMVTIQRGMEKDRGFGITRSLSDYQAQATDMRYDHFALRAVDGKVVSRKEGWGYKLRAKGFFDYTVSPEEAEKAYREPPETTRAKPRGALLGTYAIESCDWSHVTVRDAEESFRVELPLRASELSDAAVYLLSAIKER